MLPSVGTNQMTCTLAEAILKLSLGQLRVNTAPNRGDHGFEIHVA